MKIDTIVLTTKQITEAGITGHDLVLDQLNPGDSVHSFTTDQDGNHVVKILRSDHGCIEEKN